MFETHVDTLYVWVAVGTCSVAVLGVVLGMPTAAPPDATGVAATIDEVATSPPGSVVHRYLVADEWSIGSRQIGLRNVGGTARATLLTTITPARTERLRVVLGGTDPANVYGSPAAFRGDVRRAEDRSSSWRPAPDRLTVRRVGWGGTDVTLVG